VYSATLCNFHAGVIQFAMHRTDMRIVKLCVFLSGLENARNVMKTVAEWHFFFHVFFSVQNGEPDGYMPV